MNVAEAERILRERSDGHRVRVWERDKGWYECVPPLCPTCNALDFLMAELARKDEALRRIEDFCQSYLPFASPKSEVIARRVLWAIRGSNSSPPHPDRAFLQKS